MSRISFLSTVAVAASLIAAPAFAQNANNGNAGGNGYAYNTSYGNNGAYNNNGANGYEGTVGYNNGQNNGGNGNNGGMNYGSNRDNGQSGNNGQVANANGYARQLYGRPALQGSRFANNGGNSNGSNNGNNGNLNPVVSPRGYANVGFGTYAARTYFIQNGNNNNRNAGVNGNNDWRPSQRNNVLADNGDARASKVIGTSVFNARNQQLGNVQDVLLGRNGVFAVIHTNNKDVAVPFGALRFGDAMNENHDRVVLPNVTQAQLDTLPVFHYNVTNYQAMANNGNGNGNGWFGGGANNGNQAFGANGHGGGWNGGSNSG